jgi:hypothetical protein
MGLTDASWRTPLKLPAFLLNRDRGREPIVGEREQRAKEIQEAIRQVLLQWDPIGVAEHPEAQDEYDSYIGGVYRLLAAGASAAEIAEHLYQIEVGSMGLAERSTAPQDLLPVAEKLVRLDVRLLF